VYTPSFGKLDAMSVGRQSRYWLNDHIGLGLTANSNKEELPTVATSAPQT
jgi:hypothetical protein